MVVPGQRKTARLAAEQGVRYPSHVNTRRLPGGPVDGLVRENGRPAGPVLTTAHPRWGSVITPRPGCTRYR